LILVTLIIPSHISFKSTVNYELNRCNYKSFAEDKTDNLSFLSSNQRVSKAIRATGGRSCQAVEKLTSDKALPVIKLCFACIPDKFSEHGIKNGVMKGVRGGQLGSGLEISYI
jgi:hypothetical protein